MDPNALFGTLGLPVLPSSTRVLIWWRLKRLQTDLNGQWFGNRTRLEGSGNVGMQLGCSHNSQILHMSFR